MQALAGEGIGQGTERADRSQLLPRAVHGVGEALRAPTHGESVRVAPGTLEEPSAGAQPPGGVHGVRGLGYIDRAHCGQCRGSVSTARHHRVNALLSVLSVRTG